MIELNRIRNHPAKGFSLIEVMIVMAAIAILAAVAVPSYSKHIMRSRQSTAISELMAIKAAQERFYAENGRYAGFINLLEGYPGGGNSYVHGFYTYWLVPGSVAWVNFGTIRALGDLNGDGVANDGWEISIDAINAKPKPYDTGGDEGFGWSSLAHLF